MMHLSAILCAAISLLGGTHPYNLQTPPGGVTVIPAGGWHINESYPWKITASDAKTMKFSVKWNVATVSGLTKGPATWRGCVCNANTCVSIGGDVVVP